MADLKNASVIFVNYKNPIYPTVDSEGYMFVDIDPVSVSDDDTTELSNLGFTADEGNKGFGALGFEKTK